MLSKVKRKLRPQDFDNAALSGRLAVKAITKAEEEGLEAAKNTKI